MPKRKPVPPPPSPAPRVRWSDIEQEELLSRAANIVFKNPTRSALSALDGAQEAFLPPERRRRIGTLNLIPWFRDGLVPAVEKLKEQLVQEEQIKLVQEVEVVWQKLEEVETDKLLGECFRRFMEAGGHSIVKQLGQAMAECVRAELPRVIAQMRKQTEPEHHPLKRILIVGLLPEQTQVVEKGLRDCFDLRFWKNENLEALRDTARNADKIFIMKRFVSHSYQDLLKSVGASFVVVPGATSELMAVLERYYLESA